MIWRMDRLARAAEALDAAVRTEENRRRCNTQRHLKALGFLPEAAHLRVQAVEPIDRHHRLYGRAEVYRASERPPTSAGFLLARSLP